jgi:hypothetical protein
VSQERSATRVPAPVESGPRVPYFGTIIDAEEDAEGKIQDFDVPKDVVVPPAN